VRIGRKREHTVQPIQYESVKIGAWVEIDTDQDDVPDEFKGYDDYMNAILDDALAEDVDRAIGSAEQTIHVETWYEEDK
jgi:hypothetical protein